MFRALMLFLMLALADSNPVVFNGTSVSPLEIIRLVIHAGLDAIGIYSDALFGRVNHGTAGIPLNGSFPAVPAINLPQNLDSLNGLPTEQSLNGSN